MTTLAEKISELPAEIPDWQVANVLNTPDAALPIVWQSVSADSARAVLLATFEWPKLKEARTNAALSAEARVVADTMYDTLTMQKSVDLANEQYRTVVQNGLTALVAAGVFTQSAVDALMALGQRHPSWAEANNIDVTARSVGIARGGSA
jgi:hypothetical protein